MAKPSVGIYGIHDCHPDGQIGYSHDHSIAIMENGRILHYCQLERISRKKHDNSLHLHLLDLLKEKGLTKKDYDLISVDSILGRSFISVDGKLRIEANHPPKLAKGMEEAYFWNIDKASTAWVLNHELAHIYSHLPFCRNFKENSLLVHYDGGASKSNFSAWLWKEGKIHPIHHHWKLKQMSGIYNANALVFKMMNADFSNQHGVPGKFMGYAAFGNYSPKIEEWLKRNNLFASIWGSPASFFKATLNEFNIKIDSFDLHQPFLMDVAATFQEMWIESFMAELQTLAKQTSARTLYYSGGSALNIVANKRLIDSQLFETVFIPPCTEDSGLSIGAASALELQKHGFIHAHSPYINNWGIENVETKIDAQQIEAIANEVAQGKVLGICNGYGEVGPRALGNRSIIARADSVTLAQKVSIGLKKREWFRPVAPLMLAKHFNYFTGDVPHQLNKTMLLEYPILPERKSELAGAVHIDGTARIQIIENETENPFMYALLTVLDKMFNIRSVINTSFNIKGEPIVHEAVGANTSAQNIGLDGLVLNGILQKKS